MSHDDDPDACGGHGDIYDRALALRRVGGSPAIADELLGLMLEDLPAQRRTLLVALERDQHEALRRRAHRLRGSAACCGMPGLESACRAIELAVQNGAAEDIPLLAAALIEQVDAALALRRPLAKDDDQ